MPLATEMHMEDLLVPIYSVLEEGNAAMKWLQDHAAGQTVEQVVKEGICQMEDDEILEFNQSTLQSVFFIEKGCNS